MGNEDPMGTFPKSLSAFPFNLTFYYVTLHNSKDCVFLILAPLRLEPQGSDPQKYLYVQDKGFQKGFSSLNRN